MIWDLRYLILNAVYWKWCNSRWHRTFSIFRVQNIIFFPNKHLEAVFETFDLNLLRIFSIFCIYRGNVASLIVLTLHSFLFVSIVLLKVSRSVLTKLLITVLFCVYNKLRKIANAVKVLQSKGLL